MEAWKQDSDDVREAHIWITGHNNWNIKISYLHEKIGY
jgi:hypothetical protein